MKSAREIFEERKKKESSSGKASASAEKATPVKSTTSERSAREIFEERQRERGFGTSGTPSPTVDADVSMPKVETPKSMLETLGKPLIKPSAAEWAMEVMKRAEEQPDENEFKAVTSGMTPMQGVGFGLMQGYQQQKQRERASRLTAYERAYAEATANGDKELAQLLGYMLKQKEPDFRKNSKYVSTKYGEVEYNKYTDAPQVLDTGYGDYRYELINENEHAKGIKSMVPGYNKGYAYGLSKNELFQLNDEEVAVYNYLYQMDKINGTNDADKFIDLMQPEIDSRERTRLEKVNREWAKESPVIASAYNVFTSPLKAGSTIFQLLDYADDGKIEKNALYNLPIYEANARHATVSEMIDKNAGGTASFLYDAGMSAAENLYNMALGGSKAGSLALMGTTSFSTGVSNAIDRGLTAEQALGLGAISAAAEIITENVGYSAIMDTIQKGGVSAFKKSLIQNGLEEMSSATVNSIADTIIARDKSYWNMKVTEYKKQGMSEAEAFGMALWDTTLEIGKEGVAGVVSAGMMTGPSNIMQNYSQGKAFKDGKVPKSYLEGIIEEGLTSEAGSSNRKLATKLQKKIDSGQSISFYDYGKLYRENLANRGNAEIPNEEDFQKAGFTKTEFSGKITNKQIRALDAIGKALGVNISIGAPSGSGKGAYNGFYDNGRIVIAQDAENPLEVVLAHEVTHHMKRTSPVEYQKFVELAVNASEKLSGEEKAKIINEFKTMYSEGTGSNFTDTQAIDELAADFTRNIVKDVKAFRNLINADKNVAQRFLEGVKSFITKVKSTFSGDKSKMDTAAQEKYGASIEELEAAVSSWERMFAETEAGVKDGKLHNLSMNEAVEETNDLIAVHNASEDQIIEALRRGQFFMPSVAVTNKGFSKFGDISVIFDRGTIDPEETAENRLYGSDAWTPTQTELKKNPKFDEGAVEEALYGIRETIGEGAEQLFADDAERFKQKVTAADGSLYNAYSKDIGMQAAYAIEKGLISGIPTDGSGSVDIEKLQTELDAVMDADSEWRSYKRWLSGMSSEVITAYDRASDEDIMRTMEAQPDYAKRFKLSEAGELTAPVVPYSSIEDFRRNKGRLSDTAEEDAKALGAEMLELAGKISKNSGVDLSQAVEAINNAFANRYSQADIVQSFKDSGARISRKNADILQGLYRRAVELSTPYFEAKPHRSVGIDEIAAVVIPDNTGAELKAQLTDAGIRVVEYEAGNEADRLAKMNSLDDVKFSKKNTAGDESGGVQFSIKGSSEDLSIKQQMKEHLEELNRMDVIVSVNGKGFDGRSADRIVKDVVNELKYTGYAVERQGVGKIDFTEKEINKAMDYLNTDAEVLAFKALPKVLKRGKIISGHDNHKGRGFPTVTIAGPVEMNGVRGNMAVVVKQTKGNRYKVHRITTPEGSVFNLQKNDEADSTTGEPFTERKRESPIESASNNSIPETSGKSNREFSLKKNTDNLGRELSSEQAEYFKDSKVRDKDGKLITVYHGTQRGGFTVFNRTYNWYTDNSEMAQSYTQNPDVYEGYLNIKKPYIIDAKGDKWSGIAIDEETKELLDQYGSSTFKENGEWRTSTADIVSAVFDAIEEGEADYDGVIILNVNDFGSYYKGDISGIGNDYISFKSSQFKNIDNKTPTENPDIRYSLKGKSPIEAEYWEKKRTSDGDGAPGAARPTEDAGEVKGDREKLGRKISLDMTEEEKYEVLKSQKIQPQTVEVDEDVDTEYLEKNIKSIVEKPLIKKLKELGYHEHSKCIGY